MKRSPVDTYSNWDRLFPAASATALMWAGFLIFPGLSRRQSTPEAIAAKAILYWLWTSATIGTGDLGLSAPNLQPLQNRYMYIGLCQLLPLLVNKSAAVSHPHQRFLWWSWIALLWAHFHQLVHLQQVFVVCFFFLLMKWYPLFTS